MRLETERQAAAQRQRDAGVEDVRYQVGDLSGSAYLSIVEQRLAAAVADSGKFSPEWKRVYDLQQQVLERIADNTESSRDELADFVAALVGTTASARTSRFDRSFQTRTGVSTQLTADLARLKAAVRG